MSHTGMNDTIPLHGSSQSDIDEIENLIHSSITSSSAAAAVAVLPARPPSPPRASIPVVSAALPPPSKPSSSAPKPSPPPPLPISTPSASSAFGSAPNTLTEPVWDTVKRDLSHIVSNLKLVVFPNPYREDPGKALRDWDLWGPFFFIVFLGLILSWSASVKKSEVFAVAFALLAAGAVILTLNVLSLMNTELDTPLKWPNSIEGQAELPRFYRHEEDRQIKLGIFEGSPLLPLLSAKPNTRSAEYFKKCVEAYDPVKDVFVFGGKGLKLCAEETATVLGLKNEGTPYIHCSTKGNCPEYYAKFLSKNEASMVGKHEFNDVLKEMVIDDSNKFDFKRIMYAYLHSFVFIVPTTRKARNCSSFLLVETQADTEAFEKVNWAKLIYERVMDDVRKLHDMRMSGKAIGTYTITSFSQVLEAWVYYRTNEKGDKYLTQSRTLTPIAFYEPVYKCAKGLTFVADKIDNRLSTDVHLARRRRWRWISNTVPKILSLKRKP